MLIARIAFVLITADSNDLISLLLLGLFLEL